VALGTQESVAHRFADLVDSRLGGTQNGEYRNNDESALYLAQNTTIAPHLTVKEIIAKRTFSGKVVPQISEGVYLRRTVPFINNPLLQDTTTGRGIVPPKSVPRDDKSQRPQVFTNASMFLPGASTAPQRQGAAEVIQAGFRRRPEAQEAKRIAALRSDYEFRSVFSRPQQVELPSETAAAIAEAVEVKRGRGQRGPDKAPRSRRTKAEMIAAGLRGV
jgi:hypothetical protein